MNDQTHIGSLSARHRIATIVAIVGVLIVGNGLLKAWPREVEVAYEVGPNVTELDIDYLQSGSAVTSVRFNQAPQNTRVFRHTARLQPGEYQIHITLYGRDGSASEESRRLLVEGRGVTRFDLRGTGERSQ